MARILIIDDDPDSIQYFKYALENAGYMVDVIEKAPEAVDYLMTPKPDLIAIILDIQMPPGKLFAKDDHRQGTRTGVLLLSKIDEVQAAQKVFAQQQGVAQKFGGHHVPVAILTQVTDAAIIRELEEILFKRDGEHFGFWSKTGLEPKDFVEQFKEWLAAIKQMWGS